MRRGLAFARGSTALYALFSALAEKYGRGEVIIPALCCESAALAAVYAGHELRFADVMSESMCVTPGTVTPLMSARTRAVIVVHLYGIDAEAERFDALRRTWPQTAFVEDIAHALGGHHRAVQPLGGALDYALLSFAPGKIVGGDGGMLLFGDSALDPSAVEQMIPVTAPHLPQPRLALSLRNLVHGLADLHRNHSSVKIDTAFAAVRNDYRDLIVCAGGIADEAAVAAGMDQLEHNRATRYRNYMRYKAGISAQRAKVLALHEGSTCWRCPVLFHDGALAREATDTLRDASIHASNHYFPLNLLFGGERTPVAQDLAARIVNLWVEEGTPQEMVGRAIDIINDM